MSIGDRIRKLLGWMREGPAQYPTAVAIPADRVVGPSTPPTLDRDERYFAVRLNQMRLSSGREWWVHVEPMALVVTEFLYDGDEASIPFVVGPTMIKKHANKVPEGMLFEDTLVAGPHPYKGGRIAITTILYQVPTTNEARRLLALVEGIGGVAAAATNLATYLKVADVLLDGVEGVLNLDGVEPVAGRRHELDPDLEDDLGSGFFTVADSDLAPARLWVRDKKLAREDGGPEILVDVDGADLLLYRLHTMAQRSDVERLPFHDGVREALDVAQSDATDAGWSRAKALMSAAFGHIAASPDLITPHGDALRVTYRDRIKALHDEAVANANLGPASAPTPLKNALREAAEVLDL